MRNIYIYIAVFAIVIFPLFIYQYISMLIYNTKVNAERCSMSVSQSISRHLHIQTIACDSSSSSIVPAEAWIEMKRESSNNTTVFDKQIGVRLCIMFKDNSGFDAKMFCDYYVGDKIITGRQRVDSKNNTVFIIDANSIDDYEFPGTIKFFTTEGGVAIYKTALHK